MTKFPKKVGGSGKGGPAGHHTYQHQRYPDTREQCQVAQPPPFTPTTPPTPSNTTNQTNLHSAETLSSGAGQARGVAGCRPSAGRSASIGERASGRCLVWRAWATARSASEAVVRRGPPRGRGHPHPPQRRVDPGRSRTAGDKCHGLQPRAPCPRRAMSASSVWFNLTTSPGQERCHLRPRAALSTSFCGCTSHQTSTPPSREGRRSSNSVSILTVFSRRTWFRIGPTTMVPTFHWARS